MMASGKMNYVNKIIYIVTNRLKQTDASNVINTEWDQYFGQTDCKIACWD